MPSSIGSDCHAGRGAAGLAGPGPTSWQNECTIWKYDGNDLLHAHELACHIGFACFVSSSTLALQVGNCECDNPCCSDFLCQFLIARQCPDCCCNSCNRGSSFCAFPRFNGEDIGDETRNFIVYMGLASILNFMLSYSLWANYGSPR
jgi:hypothetical protein